MLLLILVPLLFIIFILIILGYTLLHTAAIHNHEDCVLFLLELNDVVVDCRDSKGNTPLHYFAEKGMLAPSKKIIEKSCNPTELLHWKNKQGKTAIELCKNCAEESKVHSELVSLLEDGKIQFIAILM